ncbi:MAG: hypothetical protein JW395_3200 [Nitrospira sp.]|nr:hypothetical protein [Nitrospira sp.]
MAWATPRTWTDGECVTVDKLTTIGTNLNETMPAKATASGDMFYATGANAIARLAKGTDGQTLRLSSGLPVWT